MGIESGKNPTNKIVHISVLGHFQPQMPVSGNEKKSSRENFVGGSETWEVGKYNV